VWSAQCWCVPEHIHQQSVVWSAQCWCVPEHIHQQSVMWSAQCWCVPEQYSGADKASYIEVFTVQRLFHMHTNLLGPIEQSAIEWFLLFREFVIRGPTG
jgi:hypothetical protein